MRYLPIFDIGKDDTFSNVDAASWSLGELCLGITCASLPTLGPLLQRCKTRFRMSREAILPVQSSGLVTASIAVNVGSTNNTCYSARFEEAKPRQETTREDHTTGTEDVALAAMVGPRKVSRLAPKPGTYGWQQDEIELLESPQGGLTSPYSLARSSTRRESTDDMDIIEALRDLDQPPRAKFRRSDHYDRD